MGNKWSWDANIDWNTIHICHHSKQLKNQWQSVIILAPFLSLSLNTLFLHLPLFSLYTLYLSLLSTHTLSPFSLHSFFFLFPFSSKILPDQKFLILIHSHRLTMVFMWPWNGNVPFVKDYILYPVSAFFFSFLLSSFLLFTFHFFL